MNKYITEFIGTLFLVLTIALAGASAGNLAPLAIGAVLIAMIYAGGHISGAHYNPAVTVGAWLRGRCARKEVLPYLLAQIGAAFVAIAIVMSLGRVLTPTSPVLNTDLALKIIIAEFLYTFALVYVILNVATAKSNSGNSFYGLAIGFTVLAGAYSVGSISGGSFNPAVSIALLMLGGLKAPIWIYILAELVAGAAAGLLFRYLNPKDK